MTAVTVYRVTTPVEDYAGRVGEVVFADGVALVPDTRTAELAYFQARGYGVEEVADEDSAAAESDVPVMPKKSASTEAWRTWAADPNGGGITSDEAAELSRDELVEMFASTEEHPS